MLRVIRVMLLAILMLLYSGRTLHQGRVRRFSTGVWPGHTISSGGSASFVTSELLPLLLLLLVLVQLLRLCLMARRLQWA